jgi:hypothetical protein
VEWEGETRRKQGRTPEYEEGWGEDEIGRSRIKGAVQEVAFLKCEEERG